MMTRITYLALAAVLAVGGYAFLQTSQGTDHSGMSGMAHDPAAAGYMSAMDNMNAGMQAAMTGDPDIDFMQMMIPHHEGAVEMAEVALEHATDPEVRALAAAVVAAQTNELDMMRAWLAAKGL